MHNQAIEILLVEDNPADEELTMIALRKNKIANTIHVARDGVAALDFLFCRGSFKDRKPLPAPKLVLLDIRLPKLDGLEVLNIIKHDPATQAIPVVMLTSSKQDEDMVKSYQYGVNSFLQKPVDFDNFCEMVRQAGLYWLLINEPPPNDAFDRVET
jgi:two-component system response regulator